MSEQERYTAAAIVLDQHATAPPVGIDRRLGSVLMTPNWTDLFKVESFERPKTWRLVHDCGAGEKEEIVFVIHGSVVDKQLPPVDKPHVKPDRYKYLRQSIAVEGLGTTMFDNALQSAAEIFGFFDRNFSEGVLEPWKPSGDQRSSSIVFEASNRYMMPRRDASAEDCIPFDQEVDPKNVLEKMAKSSDHVHTEDNQVLYFSHDKIGPQVFRNGDLVELQFSFVVVPLKGRHLKMITVLRSIALIDGRYSKVPAVMPAKQMKTPSTLKRKVGYEDLEERPNKKGMDVDAENAEDRGE